MSTLREFPCESHRYCLTRTIFFSDFWQSPKTDRYTPRRYHFSPRTSRALLMKKASIKHFLVTFCQRERDLRWNKYLVLCKRIAVRSEIIKWNSGLGKRRRDCRVIVYCLTIRFTVLVNIGLKNNENLLSAICDIQIPSPQGYSYKSSLFLSFDIEDCANNTLCILYVRYKGGKINSSKQV